MISEITLAKHFSSLWDMITPNSENVIKSLNKTLIGLRRYPFNYSKPERRALINEIGFELFSQTLQRSDAGPDGISLAGRRAMAIAAAQANQSRFEHHAKDILVDPSQIEMLESMSIANTLSSYVREIRLHTTDRQVSLRPDLRGCGILDKCEADLLVGDILIEVKSGDRNFRSLDLRQLLIYATLNYIEGTHKIRKISCVNPRRAVYFLVDIDTVCLQIANRSSQELFGELSYALSSGGISR